MSNEPDDDSEMNPDEMAEMLTTTFEALVEQEPNPLAIKKRVLEVLGIMIKDRHLPPEDVADFAYTLGIQMGGFMYHKFLLREQEKRMQTGNLRPVEMDLSQPPPKKWEW